MTRLRRILIVVGILLIALIVFVYDVIALTGTVGGAMLQAVRDLALVGAIFLMVLYAYGTKNWGTVKTPKGLGRLLLLALGVMVFAVALGSLPTSRFTEVVEETGVASPGNFATVFVALLITFRDSGIEPYCAAAVVGS